MSGHAMGLTQGVDCVAVLKRNRFAHHLVGGAGVEFHIARHRHRVGASLLQGLAYVERLDARELVDPFGDQFGEL